MRSDIFFAALAALLVCTSNIAVPANAGRLLLQNATFVNTTLPSAINATLSVSPLSVPYNTQAFANDANFTFLPGYTTNVTGQPGTLQYTVQLVNSTTGANISAWHDIPLDLRVDSNGTVTLYTLTEIPAGEQAKFETMTTMPGNPIKQDTNEAEDTAGNVIGETPRYYVYGPSLGNYGGLPQTWSNSNITSNITGFIGDNDPLDVLDISSIIAPIGGVYRVKVLGALGMIDQNETDWKVIVINVNDPAAASYADITDVPRAQLSNLLQFYANYKAAENRPNACFWPVAAVINNGSGLVGAAGAAAACNLTAAAAPADYFHGKNTALQVIRDYQEYYRWLLAGQCGGESCEELWWQGRTQQGDDAEVLSLAAEPVAEMAGVPAAEMAEPAAPVAESG